MSREKVTVVIPVYNREKYIKTAISSILKQTLKNWKMIIIDDASTDRTPDIIRKFESSRIKHVRLLRNHGTGRALQTALTMIDTPAANTKMAPLQPWYSFIFRGGPVNNLINI